MGAKIPALFNGPAALRTKPFQRRPALWAYTAANAYQFFAVLTLNPSPPNGQQVNKQR
jgi:hypothetical protein